MIDVAAIATLRTGILAGLVGGLSEIAWVSLYADITGADTGEFARAVTTAAGVRALLPAASLAAVGIAVHMMLAVALGTVLTFAWQALRAKRRNLTNPYPFMPAALTGVWAINFFVVLPIVSPAFIHLAPYAISLISKLLFGVAVAAVVREESALASGLRTVRPIKP
jgi:hypothetical protein